MPEPVTVVIASQNRRASLFETLGHLVALPERPRVILVDNGSTDGTPGAVRVGFPQVEVVELGRNLGAVARNVGVEMSRSAVVAFSDDDSWWEPGSLPHAVELFEAYPRLGLLAARILVGPQGTLDPVCTAMAASPLTASVPVPGPSVLGFVSCGTVVRREAFLEVGGFDEVVFFLGEEERVAVDLASAGWGLAYVEEVVARHHPSPARSTPDERRRLQTRNHLLSQWMRRPGGVAVGKTLNVAVRALDDPVSRGALVDAFRRLPLALRARRMPSPQVEDALRLLERQA